MGKRTRNTDPTVVQELLNLPMGDAYNTHIRNKALLLGWQSDLINTLQPPYPMRIRIYGADEEIGIAVKPGNLWYTRFLQNQDNPTYREMLATAHEFLKDVEEYSA